MGPLTKTVILIWGSTMYCAGREGIQRIPHWSMAVLVSVPKNWAANFFYYILRDGWIDIAGQCDNTISVRNSGACGM